MKVRDKSESCRLDQQLSVLTYTKWRFPFDANFDVSGSLWFDALAGSFASHWLVCSWMRDLRNLALSYCASRGGGGHWASLSIVKLLQQIILWFCDRRLAKDIDFIFSSTYRLLWVFVFRGPSDGLVVGVKHIGRPFEKTVWSIVAPKLRIFALWWNLGNART